MAKVSKRIKEEVINENKLVLSHDEHLQVETGPILVENSKLLMAVEEQNLANLILELKLLEYKIAQQKQKVGEAHLKYNQDRNGYSSIVNNIMNNHGLSSEKFSYNSNTREIIP